MAASKQSVAASISVTQELFDAIQEANLNEVTKLLAADPSAAMQTTAAGDTPLHLAVVGIIQGVLKSPKEATTTFAPETICIPKFIAICVQLMRRGAKLTTQNQESQSPKSFLLEILHNVPFNCEGFYPQDALRLFAGLGITIGANIIKLLGLEAELYQEIQALITINQQITQQIAAGYWVEPALTYVKHEQSVITQFIATYKENINNLSAITDLQFALAEIKQIPKRMLAYERENTAVRPIADAMRYLNIAQINLTTADLNDELISSSKKLLAAQQEIEQIYKTTKPTGRQLTELQRFHAITIELIRRYPTQTSKSYTIGEVQNLMAEVKDFFSAWERYSASTAAPESSAAVASSTAKFSAIAMKTGFDSISQAEQEQLADFLNLVKTDQNNLVQKRLQSFPLLATAILPHTSAGPTDAITVAAAAGQIVNVIYLIRHGASITAPNSAGLEPINLLKLALKNCNLSETDIETFLTLMKTEEEIYLLINNFEKYSFTLDNVLAEAAISPEDKRPLNDYKAEAAELISKYYANRFIPSNTSSAIKTRDLLKTLLTNIDQAYEAINFKLTVATSTQRIPVTFSSPITTATASATPATPAPAPAPAPKPTF